MTASPTRTVIVGAGSAGCVLAARLSADPGRRVTLLEAGPGARRADRPAELSSADFFDARSASEWWWPELHARRTADSPAVPYLRGRGLGGSSAINAMIARPSHPDDHTRWETLGAGGWGWDEVSPWFSRTAISTSVASRDEVGAVSRALLDALPGEAELARLTLDASRRRISAADAYLEPITATTDSELSGGRLHIAGSSLVDKVCFDGTRAVGVRLADGREVAADEVILAAGAIHSPAILLRSGLTHRGIGRNAKDHPAVAFSIALDAEFIRPPGTLPISVVGTWTSGDAPDDLQLLPIDHLGTTAPGFAVMMIALMRVESQGVVMLASDDPRVDPTVDLKMLSARADRARLGVAAKRTQLLLQRPEFKRLGELIDIDVSPDALDQHLGDYVHIAGTCRMGAPTDPDAVVDSQCNVIGYRGLRVCDGSVMPDLPRTNPHLLTVVIAERIAAQMLASNSSIASRK